MLCSKCGEPVNVGEMFCGNCGSPVQPSSLDSKVPSAGPPIAPETTTSPSSIPGYSSPPQTSQGPPPPIVGGAQAPSSQKSDIRFLHIFSIISILIGGYMLLTLDFARWEDKDDYYGTWEYGYIYRGYNIFLDIIYLAVVILLLFCIYVSIRGLISKGLLPRSLVRSGFFCALTAFAIIIICAVIFFIAVAGVDYAWLEGGFFGGAAGSFIAVLSFWYILKKTPEIAPASSMPPPPIPSTQPPMAPQLQYTGPLVPPMISPDYSKTQAGAPTPSAQVAERYQQPAQQQPQYQQPQYQGPPQAGQPQYQPPPQQGYQRPAQQQPQPQQQYQQPAQQQYPQPAPSPYQQPSPPTNPCPTCGHPLRFQPEGNKWYCDNCRKNI